MYGRVNSAVVTVRSTTQRRTRSRRMYARPSRIDASIERRVRTSIGCGAITRSAATTARYEIALMSMSPPTPNGMMSTPPTSGPTSVAPLKAAELRPMALMSSLSVTRRGTIA